MEELFVTDPAITSEKIQEDQQAHENQKALKGTDIDKQMKEEQQKKTYSHEEAVDASIEIGRASCRERV